MDMVKVIEAPKEKFTWIGPLKKLKVKDGSIYFWYADRGKVSPLISKDIRVKFPDREYETVKEVIKGLEYLKVWRNK
jgi:hypothetical protein